jgi:hypothetical protein
LQRHISGMIGSYTGAITAFLVNQGNHLKFIPEVILWLAPTAILTPLIIFEIRKLKAKNRLSTNSDDKLRTVQPSTELVNYT